MTNETQVGGIAGDMLRSYIERIERLNEDLDALKDDVKDVYAEAKGTGFDTKIMRRIVRKRKIDADLLAEQEEVEELYRSAIGMK